VNLEKGLIQFARFVVIHSRRKMGNL